MSKYIYVNSDDRMNQFENNFYNKKNINEHPQKPYFDCLKSILTPETSFFEIGCGRGRIFNFVKNHVKEYIGIEPDIERFKVCEKLLKNNTTFQCFQFINSFSNEYIKNYPTKKFDVVCISHVIQHVSTYNAVNILNDAFNLLNDDGKLILSTTCAPREIFTYDKKNISDIPSNFNNYCYHNQTNRGLPVHMFTKESLFVYLQKFEIKYYEQYQFIRRDKLNWFCENFFTTQNEIVNVGQSQFVVCQKKSYNVDTSS
jgi:SAM-dependent methyltransferase